MNNILYYKYRNRESYHISRGALNSEVKKGERESFSVCDHSCSDYKDDRPRMWQSNCHHPS